MKYRIKWLYNLRVSCLNTNMKWKNKSIDSVLHNFGRLNHSGVFKFQWQTNLELYAYVIKGQIA
jgi:hypothetical protein